MDFYPSLFSMRWGDVILSIMTEWSTLARELDAWQEANLRPTFWWRDDDAAKPVLSLRRLIELSRKHKVPVSLAVIPLPAGSSLRPLLINQPLVSILQHGYSHRNHSARGEARSEFAGRRAVSQSINDIEKGRRKMRAMFPGRQLDVLVPPWGRISDEVMQALGQTEIIGLSMGEDTDTKAVPGLRRVDVHVDIVKWGAPVSKAHSLVARTAARLGVEFPGPQEFVGLSAALDQVVRHLALRRTGAVDPTTPTGLMTHHLAHDERCWEFIDRFLALTCEYPSVCWMRAEELFLV